MASKNSLETLRTLTTVVADTGDFESMKKFRPRDATTNPSLILAAANMPRYRHLVEAALEYAKGNKDELGVDERISLAVDKLFVLFGSEILKIVPGRVSTEVDARLSFDVEGQVKRALRLVDMYLEEGVAKERVLIKLSSTWEGIRAAEILESRHGIRCNLTLLFSMAQAIACAEAGVTLISPFVGRILDWHMAHGKASSFTPEQDPGVLSVTKIYNYYRKHGYRTVVMGASFRNVGQVKALAGCDLLTVSPQLLAQLEESNDEVPRRLSPETAATHTDVENKKEEAMSEKVFRFMLNEDEMASDKLAEGIRKFAADQRKMDAMVADMLKA